MHKANHQMEIVMIITIKRLHIDGSSAIIHIATFLSLLFSIMEQFIIGQGLRENVDFKIIRVLQLI